MIFRHPQAYVDSMYGMTTNSEYGSTSPINGMFRQYRSFPTKMGSIIIRNMDEETILTLKHNDVGQFHAEILMDHMTCPYRQLDVDRDYSYDKVSIKEKMVYIITDAFGTILASVEDEKSAQAFLEQVKKNRY